MVKKEWYVLHQTQKYGPFAQKQILEMLKTGSVMRSQKIWREGLEEPITSYELFLTSMKNEVIEPKVNESSHEGEEEDVLPPPMPISSNPEKKIEKPQKKESIQKSQLLDDHQKEFNKDQLDKIHKPKKSEVAVQKPEKDQEVSDIINEVANFKQISGAQDTALPPLPPDIIRQKQNTKKRKSLVKYGLISIAFLLSVFVFFFVAHDLYYVKFNRSSRPRFVDIKDFKYLQRAQKKNISQNTVAILTSKDSESIVLGTNFLYDTEIEIELSSQESKVLTNDKILLRSKGSLVSGLAHFKELEFIKGQRIYPGYYNVKISSSNEKRNLYWYDKWFPAPQKLIMEDLSIYLGHLPIKIYKKKMERFLKKRNKRERQFLGDLEQKWATLEGIIGQLKQELIDLIATPASKWKKSIKVFEDKYTKVFGSFFTEFYLNNQQVQRQLKKTEVRKMSQYNSQYNWLSKIAQLVGKKTVSIIERASAFNFAPNAGSRANITSDIIKSSDRFLEKIAQGKKQFSDLKN